MDLYDCWIPKFKYTEHIEIDSGTIYSWYEEDKRPDLNISWQNIYDYDKNWVFKHCWAIPREDKDDIIREYLKREQFNLTNFFDYTRAFTSIKNDIAKICEVEINHLKRRIDDYRKHIELIKNCGYYSLYDENDCYDKSISALIKELFSSIEYEKKQIEYQKEYQNERLTKVFEYQGKIDKIYDQIFQYCLDEKHQWLGAYYQRGIINFNNGNILETLQDIEKLIENSKKLKSFISQIYFLKGKAEVELGLYHDAIVSLYVALKEDPKNKEAYFERAQAYFELGEFDKANK